MPSRLDALRKAGLSELTTLSLLQLRTGGDFMYVARTCGIPPGDAARLDALVESQVFQLMGAGAAPYTADQVQTAFSARELATSRTFIPERMGGLGLRLATLGRGRRAAA